MRTYSTRLRGFTLIELLCVMSCVAILASILFPVFARAREAARSNTCRADLHQIGLALRMYARDYDGKLPPDPNDFAPLASPYVNGVSIFICPDDAEASLQPLRGPQPTAGSAPAPINPGLVAVPPSPLFCSYQYRGGPLTEDAPGDTPVVADWTFMHSERANVLYLSGAVRGVDATRWAPLAPGPRPYAPRESVDSGRPVMSFLPSSWRPPAANAPAGARGNFPAGNPKTAP